MPHYGSQVFISCQKEPERMSRTCFGSLFTDSTHQEDASRRYGRNTGADYQLQNTMVVLLMAKPEAKVRGTPYAYDLFCFLLTTP